MFITLLMMTKKALQIVENVFLSSYKKLRRNGEAPLQRGGVVEVQEVIETPTHQKLQEETLQQKHQSQF